MFEGAPKAFNAFFPVFDHQNVTYKLGKFPTSRRCNSFADDFQIVICNSADLKQGGLLFRHTLCLNCRIIFGPQRTKCCFKMKLMHIYMHELVIGRQLLINNAPTAPAFSAFQSFQFYRAPLIADSIGCLKSLRI